MTERELRDRLRTARLDVDPASERRAWLVVRNAYHPVTPHPRRRRRPGRLLITASALAVLTAIALSTITVPRHAVAGWLRDAFGVSASPRTVASGERLPGGGALLLQTTTGSWLEHADGSRHYLGPFTGAAWSPHSLYIVAWRAAQLTTLTPTGTQQWTLRTTGPISTARWSPDGYRIAFNDGTLLRVVAGDGSSEHPVAYSDPAIAPVWQPGTGTTHRLTFVTPSGRIEQINADTGARDRTLRVPEPARELLWSPDGRVLLVLGAHTLSAYTPTGRHLATFTSAPSTSVTRAAFLSRATIAIDLADSGGPDSIELLSTPHLTTPRVLYSGLEQFSDINLSADHRWLLASSASSDQWLFFHIGPPARLIVQSNITANFARPGRRVASFPRLAGWQPQNPNTATH